MLVTTDRAGAFYDLESVRDAEIVGERGLALLSSATTATTSDRRGPTMIDHLSTYALDYDATVAFYDAALTALGYARNTNMVAAWDPDFPTRRLCAYGPGGRPVFWVAEDKGKHTPRHVAFVAKDRAGVHAFHGAGLAAGGEDNGKPGPREHYHPGYYGGFLIDPDGNNVEAVVHEHP